MYRGLSLHSILHPTEKVGEDTRSHKPIGVNPAARGVPLCREDNLGMCIGKQKASSEGGHR